MNCLELYSIAKKNNQLEALLRGEGQYKIERSELAPGVEPTDTGVVLSDVIYAAYKKDRIVKAEFERTLKSMMKGTDYDVYIVVLYIVGQLFMENHGLSPFEIDISSILEMLREEIRKREPSIQTGIVFPDGSVFKMAWYELERFKKNCLREYGVELF